MITLDTKSPGLRFFKPQTSRANPDQCSNSSPSEARDVFVRGDLDHIVTTRFQPEEVDTPEERRAASQDLIALMREYPKSTMAVGIVSGENRSQAIVAGPKNAVSSVDTVGIYEFVQRIGNSPGIKERARAFPSSYQAVQTFDPKTQTDLVQLPGPQTPESVLQALAEGGKTNNQAMLEGLLGSLPQGERAIFLIGGPSGAGKSHLIRNLQKLAGDRNLVTIEGDNYFRDVDDPGYPKLENRQHYFDHYDALDHATMKSNFRDLVQTGKARIPVYDFGAIHGDEKDWNLPVKGVRTGYRELELQQDDILVFDSLPATNSDLLDHLREKELPVVSVYLDTPSSNDRLVRRIVRDYHHRGGISPDQTMEFWDNTTRRGEIEFIRPSMKAVDPVQGVFLLTEFEGEPHISRNEIEDRSQAMKIHGLMPEYEAFNVTAEDMGQHTLIVEKDFKAILQDPASTEEEKAKAEKGLALIESARKDR